MMPKPNPTPTPQPVVTATVCSLCGLDWSRHPEKATAADCVVLLKAELSSRPTWSSGVGGVVPNYPRVPQNFCSTTVGYDGSSTTGVTLSGGLSVVRPDNPDDGCAPIGVPA